MIIEPYVPNYEKLIAFICDIDGTLADHEGLRGHFDYAKVYFDKPIWPIIFIVKALISTKKILPIFVSGRENSCRNDTVLWLESVMPELRRTSNELLMRDAGDHRKDFIIKYEKFNEYIRNNYCVIFALDDRTQVVEMWRELGIRTLQVDKGDF